MKNNSYIGELEIVSESRGGYAKLHLLGQINKCGVIKPRYPIKYTEYEEFEKRYLPSIAFGMIIVSTSQGIMTNEQAKEKGIGGKLLAYCY